MQKMRVYGVLLGAAAAIFASGLCTAAQGTTVACEDAAEVGHVPGPPSIGAVSGAT